MNELKDIVGKTVVTIRGYTEGKGKKNQLIGAKYILFGDRETYIELEEQDYYSYHDCAGYARIIHVYQDSKVWDLMHNDLKKYPVATTDP